jgi:methyltransferase (TIGR00027 family)
MSDINIQHVSDTAKWIAAYRALESERPDAVFNDHLARKLAGKEGFKMVLDTPNAEPMAFAIVTRTTAIDRLIHSAIKKGVDTVINLGAGLDTRPYRMQLPNTLRWIEVDFRPTVDYKNVLLKDDQPKCNLTRIANDLSDDNNRQSMFTELGAQTNKALIITEGVVAYLTNESAARLSHDLFSIPTFHYWIMDYSQGPLRKNNMSKKISKKLTNAPWLFDEDKPIEFFARTGWHVDENIYIIDEGDRIGRRVPLKFPYSVARKVFPKMIRELGNKTYGYVMLTK